MSNFETFQPPKVADESIKQASQACQREAHDRAVRSLNPQSQAISAEFGNFSISHPDEKRTAIQAGITENHAIRSTRSNVTVPKSTARLSALRQTVKLRPSTAIRQ